jgi:hypothetical protein
MYEAQNQAQTTTALRAKGPGEKIAVWNFRSYPETVVIARHHHTPLFFRVAHF